MTCESTTLSLGVYLLGSLDAAEQAEVERHLQTCVRCRDELDQLVGLPPMLDLLTLDDFAVEPPDVPEDLFERVAARAREEVVRQRTTQTRRYRRLTAVAAAFVLVVAGSLGTAVALHHGHHARPALQAGITRAASLDGVSMRVTLASQASGTGLKVAVAGLPENEHCRLIAIAKDGRRDVAGRWSATYGGQAQQLGSTVIPSGQISQLVLYGNGGKRLVTVSI